MSLQLNRFKSVLVERLVYRKNLVFIGTFLYELTIFITAFVFCIFLISKPEIKVEFKIVAVVIVTFLLISWYYIYKLLPIKITEPNKDRKLLIELITEKYSKFKIIDNGLNILRSKSRIGYFNWGQKLTIIYDDEKILVNLTTLAKHEINSVFHSIYNYLQLQKLRKEFYNRKNGS